MSFFLPFFLVLFFFCCVFRISRQIANLSCNFSIMYLQFENGMFTVCIGSYKPEDDIMSKRQTFRTSSACLPPNCGLLVMMYSLSLRRELSQARLVTANAVNANGLGELTTRAIRKLIEYVASLYSDVSSNSEAIYIRILPLIFPEQHFERHFCCINLVSNICRVLCYCSMRKCGPMFAGSLQRRIVAIDHYQHLLQTHRSESNGEVTELVCFPRK